MYTTTGFLNAEQRECTFEKMACVCGSLSFCVSWNEMESYSLTRDQILAMNN